MTKTILAAAFAVAFAGAAFAEGEGYATTGDWREVPAQPASGGTAAQKHAGSFDFNQGLNGQG